MDGDRCFMQTRGKPELHFLSHRWKNFFSTFCLFFSTLKLSFLVMVKKKVSTLLTSLTWANRKLIRKQSSAFLRVQRSFPRQLPSWDFPLGDFFPRSRVSQVACICANIITPRRRFRVWGSPPASGGGNRRGLVCLGEVAVLPFLR